MHQQTVTKRGEAEQADEVARERRLGPQIVQMHGVPRERAQVERVKQVGLLATDDRRLRLRDRRMVGEEAAVNHHHRVA